VIGRFAHAMALVVASLGIPCAASASPAPDEPTVEQVRAQDASTERRTYVVGRARISTAQELSLGASAFVVRQPVDHDCATACYFRGLLVQLEPGLGGGQLAVGYAVAVAETRTTPWLVRAVHVGYAFKGALLRTWGDEGSDPPQATWLGVESEFTIVKVNFSLGAFRRVSGESAEDRWLVTAGIGWGF
jgi:hypothetical protein